MLELVKRNIHMNRRKGQINTQVTLDDDFIVPDTMSDAEQVILDAGEIQLEPVKLQTEKVIVRGKLDFHVLYRREGGGLQTLGGMIPFEETVNVPGLADQDDVGVGWHLEDLETDIINSRKLGIRAVVTLEVRVENILDAEAAVDLGPLPDEGDVPQVEVRKETLPVAAIAVRRKDTWRLKDTVSIGGNRPAIGRILWSETRLGNVSTRPLDGQIHLDGAATVFVIYEGEGGGIQWLEESIPFSGELELKGASEEMIPVIGLRLIHRDLGEKPDEDGEMRELEIDAVIELDMRLYEEQELEILSDLYAINCELSLETEEADFDEILARNTGKCRVADSVSLGQDSRVLQICHSFGTVKLDEVEAGEDMLSMDGVLEVRLLYLTDDDSRPIQSVTEPLPFHYEAEVPGISQDAVWYLEPAVEQLTSVMTGQGTVDVKAVISLDLLVLHPLRVRVIRSAQEQPLDAERLKRMPGIVGYLVQEGDTLWDIARRFHTTIGDIMETNDLASEQVSPGDSLILVKELSRE
ncbi:MAG: DUF3794 domain-containing protein [Clostridiales bacterium]|nr:DUF3794 domain-containing protein [Clostridiales bacterium]